LNEASSRQLVENFLNRLRPISKYGYYIIQAPAVAAGRNYEEYFREERSVSESQTMQGILPRERLGIERLVEALSEVFYQHVANRYHHHAHDT
jgi:hypothetical protein